jgi:hypothetical protein
MVISPDLFPQNSPFFMDYDRCFEAVCLCCSVQKDYIMNVRACIMHAVEISPANPPFFDCPHSREKDDKEDSPT